MPTIFTHSLQHHADEVMACAILSMLYPEMKIVRTQDLSKAGPDDYVVDTGMVYDPETNRFDHHQSKDLPSACMLVWEHKGIGLIQKLGGEVAMHFLNHTQKIHKNVSERLMQPISDIDCGKRPSATSEFNQLIRNFNSMSLFKEDDGPFWMAFHIAKPILIASIHAALQAAVDEEDYFTHTSKRNGYRISPVKHGFIGWKEMAAKEGIYFLVAPNPRGGWQLVSRDTNIIRIPKDEHQTFLHNSGFIASYEHEHQAVQAAVRLVDEAKKNEEEWLSYSGIDVFQPKP